MLDRLFRPRAPRKLDGTPATALPDFYTTVFDPLDTLAFVAARTEHIELGTSVLLALLQPPALLARRLATIDQLSGGRVIAGLGQGWMPEEFALAGVPFIRRGRRITEYVRALRTVWGPDPVRFDGEFYTIPESDIGPKPARPGGIPILLGYTSQAAIRRAARIADGLNPNRQDLATLRADVALFRRSAEEAGRDPARLPVIFRAAARLTERELGESDRALFHGTIAQWSADAEALATIGIQHLFVGMRAPIDAQLSAVVDLRDRVSQLSAPQHAGGA